MGEPFDVLVTYVPRGHTVAVLEALFAAGAGAMGDYEHCAFVSEGTGQFRPVRDARPVIGYLGELEHVLEHRLELVVPRRLRGEVVRALLLAHPYEMPAFHVLETATVDEA
jgi:hypothetical protein